MKRLLALAVTALLFAGVACTSAEVPSDSETHFLRGCEGGCGDLECICGVCTRACRTRSCLALSEVSACRGLLPNVPAACPGGAPAEPYCDVSCRDDGDCRVVGSRLICVGGACRPPGFEIVREFPDAGSGASDAAPSKFDLSPPPDEPDAGEDPVMAAGGLLR